MAFLLQASVVMRILILPLLFMSTFLCTQSRAMDLEEIKGLLSSGEEELCSDKLPLRGSFDPSAVFRISEGVLVLRKDIALEERITVELKQAAGVSTIKCAFVREDTGYDRLMIKQGAKLEIVIKDLFGGRYTYQALRHCKSGHEFVIECSKKNISSQEVINAFGEYFNFHLTTRTETLN